MIRSAIAVFSLLAFASPALAAEEPEAVAKDEKMVCKRVANTGWRLNARQVCKKAGDWNERSRDQRKEMQDYGSVSGRSRCLGCGD